MTQRGSFSFDTASLCDLGQVISSLWALINTHSSALKKLPSEARMWKDALIY